MKRYSRNNIQEVKWNVLSVYRNISSTLKSAQIAKYFMIVSERIPLVQIINDNKKEINSQ